MNKDPASIETIKNNDPAWVETTKLHGDPIEPGRAGAIAFMFVGFAVPFTVAIVDFMGVIFGYRILARSDTVMSVFPIAGLVVGLATYIVARYLRKRWWERYGEALKRLNEIEARGEKGGI